MRAKIASILGHILVRKVPNVKSMYLNALRRGWRSRAVCPPIYINWPTQLFSNSPSSFQVYQILQNKDFRLIHYNLSECQSIQSVLYRHCRATQCLDQTSGTMTVVIRLVRCPTFWISSSMPWDISWGCPTLMMRRATIVLRVSPPQHWRPGGRTKIM